MRSSLAPLRRGPPGVWFAVAVCMAVATPWPTAAITPEAPGGEASGPALTEAADRHSRAGRFLAATAVMDRYERAFPHTTADFEGAYATALGNGALEARVVRGLPIPGTRSSIERVALVRKALGRVATGESKSARPAQTRDLRVVRAGMLVLWGFAREGYQEYWSAHGAQPLDSRIAGQAAWLEARFADPVSDAAQGPSSERPGAR